ncbi:MAG: Asp-tRNA(Asn)/Glu-tRNA(Gln) amidotransferase subunit GatB [Candidatus Gracilibacteria bacterium]|nr:Asp-tRNA(Asn)/Glu-tRNA(Gln) amidotransferase subunit GatB [Candidatus Gracilibacteria bacterium]
MEFETVIGLEIHAQISTKTKMFCRCAADAFGKEPNVNTCPVCMGFPGQLPVINNEAVKKGVIAALALNCEIPEYCKFDRKNYFYPDSPKGFQISQFDEPLSKNGWVDIEVGVENSRKIKVRITRLHLEDDAGKLTHVRNGSLVDFNRSGEPLMEIVSDPDMRSAEEASAYAREIQKILRYVGSSEADMEKGMMRFDASVSIRPKGEDKLYPRSEIKNLNSFKSLESAIEFEIKRQTGLWEEGSPLKGQTTVGWNEEKQETYFMRDKEDSDDYRYFPEPDLPPLYFDRGLIDKYKKELPELPQVKKQRYIEEMNLAEDDARILAQDLKMAQYFEKVVAGCGDIKKAVSFINTVLMKHLREELISVEEQKVTPEMMIELIKLVNDGVISNSLAKSEVFEEMYSAGKFPKNIVEEKGFKQVSDASAIELACKKIVEENPQSIIDIKAGKDKAIGFLVGQVMKEMKGQGNPQVVNEVLKKVLADLGFFGYNFNRFYNFILMFATSGDILNMALAIGFLVLVIFLSILIFYFILVLRDVSKIVDDVEDITERFRATIIEPLRAVDFLVEKVKPYVEMVLEQRGKSKKSVKKSK